MSLLKVSVSLVGLSALIVKHLTSNQWMTLRNSWRIFREYMIIIKYLKSIRIKDEWYNTPWIFAQITSRKIKVVWKEFTTASVFSQDIFYCYDNSFMLHMKTIYFYCVSLSRKLFHWKIMHGQDNLI
jgi:hypothetical protein